MCGNFGNIDTKIVENIMRIFHLITVYGDLRNEFGNFKNSFRIVKYNCTTYKKVLLVDRVPLMISLAPLKFKHNTHHY